VSLTQQRARQALTVLLAAVGSAVVVIPAAGPVETLRPVAALPAHIAGAFQDVSACRQSNDGTYFIFDRRAHSVYIAPPTLDTAVKLIEIGAEAGRVLDPSAFDLATDGTFAVADAPRGRARVQIFTTSGSTLGGFFLQGRAVPRIVLRNTVLNGVGSVEYTGRTVFLSQPELGAVIVEYNTDGSTARLFGELRRTGHELQPAIHLALNSGMVVSNPRGGLYFVFLAGVPQFRKYDSSGRLLFVRHIEGVELDRFIQTLPDTWKPLRTEEGEIPLVLPSVLGAAVDPSGNLWISLAAGVTYVYDQDGDKTRTVQFHAAGPLAPTGMSFTSTGRLLVSPGCFAFAAGRPTGAPARGRQ
jgi:hypothetical protein